MGERRFSRRVMAVHKTSILTNRGSRIAGSGCMTYVRTYVSIHALGRVQAVPVQRPRPASSVWDASGRGKAKASGRGSDTGSDKDSVQESVWAPAEHTFGFGPGIGFGPDIGFGPGGVGFGRGVAHAKGNICTLLYLFYVLTYCPSQCRYTYVRTYLRIRRYRTYVKFVALFTYVSCRSYLRNDVRTYRDQEVQTTQKSEAARNPAPHSPRPPPHPPAGSPAVENGSSSVVQPSHIGERRLSGPPPSENGSSPPDPQQTALKYLRTYVR